MTDSDQQLHLRRLRGHEDATGTSANAWLFAGELNDTTVARSPYYLRARYYDPALGRFLSGDPFAGFALGPQSQNRYIYNGNDPVDLVDPYGLCGLRSIGDVGDCGKKAVRKVGEGAQAAGQAIQSGAEWLGEDHHRVTVAEVGGSAAFLAGVSIVSGGTATPLMLGLGTGLMSGGVAVGTSAYAFDVFGVKARQVTQGDMWALAEGGVTLCTAPFSFMEGPTAQYIGWGGVAFGHLRDIVDGSPRTQKAPEQSSACIPRKE